MIFKTIEQQSTSNFEVLTFPEKSTIQAFLETQLVYSPDNTTDKVIECVSAYFHNQEIKVACLDMHIINSLSKLPDSLALWHTQRFLNIKSILTGCVTRQPNHLNSSL